MAIGFREMDATIAGLAANLSASNAEKVNAYCANKDLVII